MSAEVKFCGLTRPADAAYAASLGASHVGVILVGGPRLLTPQAAREVLAAAVGPKRVAVVPLASAVAMAAQGREVGADILQLHADPTLEQVHELRSLWAGGIWAVVRMGPSSPRTDLAALFAASDAVVADTLSPGGLGGSGRQFEWNLSAAAIIGARGQGRLVLAGGLTSDNISEAVRALDPDVVDVSSGVEDAPGVKSHDRMRTFSKSVPISSPPSRA